MANFETYSSIPTGPVSNDCVGYYSLSNVLDNGFWNINASLNPNSGTYNATLYNTNFSPTANFATVLKSSITPPTSFLGYLRSKYGFDYIPNRNEWLRCFRTSFYSYQLPIELISFSELLHSNSSYFTIEHSVDGLH
ncbi:MAG: hypothetical protein IPH33_10655 [Bacteroidetes bacterium]|nr:hypothetical protein [Bacteroidota bacterium]